MASDCNFHIFIGPWSRQTACDKAKDFLGKAGLSFSSVPASAGVDVVTRIGDIEIKGWDEANFKEALQKSGYPPKADLSQVNWVMAEIILFIMVIYVTMVYGPIAAFLVEKDSPGMDVSRKLEKMGVRTSPMAEVFFENCKGPEENLLGKEGGGAFLFTRSMTWERGCILASAVGSMQRLLETCIRYANERKQGGQSIGKYQLVASKIVDMKVRVESSRHMLYHYGWLSGHRKAVYLEAAMTKLHIAYCWVKCCEDAIQIHGGYGYMTEYEVERELRDAIGSKLYSGTSEIQRNIIASMLGL